MGGSPPRTVAEPSWTADQEHGCGEEVIEVRKMRVGLGALVMLLALSLPVAAFADSVTTTTSGGSNSSGAVPADTVGGACTGQGTVDYGASLSSVETYLDTVQTANGTGFCGLTDWTLAPGQTWNSTDPGAVFKFIDSVNGLIKGTVEMTILPQAATPETPYTAIFAISAIGALGIGQVIRRRRNAG